MAGYDPGRYDEVMDWPLRDLFLGFIDRLRDQARRNYEVELIVWAVLAPHQKRQSKAPDLPEILRG
jgi:hypothetical protein